MSRWLEQPGAAEHRGGLPCAGAPGVEVGAARHQGSHDLLLALEDGAGDRRLVAVVGKVDVGPVRDQHVDRVGVTVVGGEHEQGVALCVAGIDREGVLEKGTQLRGVALAGEVHGDGHDAGFVVGADG